MHNKQTRDYLATILFPLIILGFSAATRVHTQLLFDNNSVGPVFFTFISYLVPPLFGLLLVRLALITPALYQRTSFLVLIIAQLLLNLILFLSPFLFALDSSYTLLFLFSYIFTYFGAALFFSLTAEAGVLSGVFLFHLIRCLNARRKKSKTAALDGASASGTPSA